MIGRRRILIGVASVAALPADVRAQKSLPRLIGTVGYLHPHTLHGAATYQIMAPVWRALGLVEGETLLSRSADGDYARIPDLLDELVRASVDVLILIGPQVVKIASKQVRSVPIVAVDLESDPVREAFVETIGRPGRNITGLFMDFPDIAAKWLQLLRECAPGIDHVVILWDPSTGRSQAEAVSTAAHRLKIGASLVEAKGPEEAGIAVRSLNAKPTTGVVRLGGPATSTSDHPLTDALHDLRLPSIFHLKRYVIAGGLMSYGARLESYFPRALELTMKILQGTPPAELPIERPASFELVVNLKTARALGLTIPPSILVRADEVIE